MFGVVVGMPGGPKVGGTQHPSSKYREAPSLGEEQRLQRLTQQQVRGVVLVARWAVRGERKGGQYSTSQASLDEEQRLWRHAASLAQALNR